MPDATQYADKIQKIRIDLLCEEWTDNKQLEVEVISALSFLELARAQLIQLHVKSGHTWGGDQ